MAEFVALRHNRFTRDGYSAALERFAGFCGRDDTDAAHADSRLLAAFRDELAASAAAATVRFELAVLSSFFRWLRAEGVREDNPRTGSSGRRPPATRPTR